MAGQILKTANLFQFNWYSEVAFLFRIAKVAMWVCKIWDNPKIDGWSSDHFPYLPY